MQACGLCGSQAITPMLNCAQLFVLEFWWYSFGIFWPKFWSHWLILYDLNLLVQAPLLLSSKPAIKPSIAFTKKPKASFGTQMVNVAHDVALDGPAVPCCSG